MKILCFWSTVSLLAIVLCLDTAKSTQLLKGNVPGQSLIDGHFCGNELTRLYSALCASVKRKLRRSTSIDEQEALSFLHHQSPRRTGSSTDATEECCNEGCPHEEIMEYCW